MAEYKEIFLDTEESPPQQTATALAPLTPQPDGKENNHQQSQKPASETQLETAPSEGVFTMQCMVNITLPVSVQASSVSGAGGVGL
jgi:hypothetical protein